MGIYTSKPQGGGTDLLKFINDFVANLNKMEDNKHQKNTVKVLRKIQRDLQQQKKTHRFHLILSIVISSPLSATFGYVLCTFV